MAFSRMGRNLTQLTSDRPLSNDQMLQVAPSIFADGKHESRSERYSYIPTVTVLEGLRAQGFQPFSVAQSRSRIPGKADFTKHMVRLRHADKTGKDGSPEIILQNAHDGTSSYKMMGGWFEFLCYNGLVRGETAADKKIPHKGNVTDQVIDVAFEVLGSLDQVIDQRDAMRALTVNRDAQHAFAKAALELRYEEGEAPIKAQQLLTARRREEINRNDLWNTFNVVQENMIRGGLSGRNANLRRVSTREVTGIDQGTKLNRALWVLAEEMQKILAPAAI